MITIPIDKSIADHCKKLISEVNFGQRGKADGNRVEQYIGIVSQCMIMDIFGLPWIEASEGHDSGVDMILNQKRYDVKSMGRTCYPQYNYVNNFVEYQAHFNVDRYIFCSVNKLTADLTICGWIEKADFFDKAILYPEGTIRTRADGTTFTSKAGLYELKNSSLIGANNIQELREQLC